ncbi:alpha/beta fold hydrolase [Paenibacillus planticolens]|nr:alpha/beta hydrolase [Paenibacillus planticolens]
MIEPNIVWKGGDWVSFAHVNGVSLYYELIPSARSSDETIVFLHGNGFNSSRWGHIIDGLKEDYHLLLVDLRGCGQSESIPGEVSWDLYTDDLYALIEHLNIEAFHLLGHSFGGSLAVCFAARYPNLVKCLVLISINVLFPEDGNVVVENYIALVEKYGIPYILQNFLVPSLTVFAFEHEEAQHLYNMYLNVSAEMYAKMFKLQNQQRPINELAAIQSPTLLLAGECDTVYPPSFQNMTSGLIPHSTFYVVPNAGNAVFIDQPAVTVQWIKSFIQREMHTQAGARITYQSENMNSIQHFMNSIQHLKDSFLQTIFISKRNTEPVLKVELLHGFRVTLNGREILDGWNKRYAKNIFAHLVVQPSSTREDLCDAVFPMVPLPTALKNLKVYINYLKKLVTYHQDSILKTDRQNLYLQCNIECDLLDFFDHIRRTMLLDDNGGAKYDSCERLFASMRQKEIMPEIFDQWFIEKKASTELRLGVLAAWMSEQEEKRNNCLKASEYKKLANYYLSEDE